MKLKNIKLDVVILLLVFFSIFFQKNIFLIPKDIYIKYQQTKKLEEIYDKYVKEIDYNLDINLKKELHSYNYEFLSKLIILKEEIIRTKYIDYTKNINEEELNVDKFYDMSTLDDILDEGQFNEAIKIYLNENPYLNYQDLMKKIYYNLSLIREDKAISNEEELYLNRSLNMISNTIKKDFELQKKLIDIGNDMDYRKFNIYDLNSKNKKMIIDIESKLHYERYQKLNDFLEKQIKLNDYLFILDNSKDIVLDSFDKKDENKEYKEKEYDKKIEYRDKVDNNNRLFIKKLFSKLSLKELKDNEISLIETNYEYRYNIKDFGSVAIYNNKVKLNLLNIKSKDSNLKAVLKSINKSNYFVSKINTNRGFSNSFENEYFYNTLGRKNYLNIDYIKKTKNYFDEDNKLEMEFIFDEYVKEKDINALILTVQNKDMFFKEYDYLYEDRIRNDIKIIKKELVNLELLNIMPVKINEELKYKINARGADKEDFNIEIDIEDSKIQSKEVKNYFRYEKININKLYDKVMFDE